MFTEVFIEKLKVLRGNLGEMASKEYKDKEGSDHSKEMVEQFIETVNELINNNSVSYWKNGKHQEWLEKRLDFIDNYSGTHTPVVFNKQSLDLADLLSLFVKELNVDNDLDSSSRTGLNLLLGDVNRFIDRYKRNLDFKINVYQILLEETQGQERFVEAQKDIYENLDKLLVDINALTEETKDNFVDKYNKTVVSMLEKLDENDLPYLMLSGALKYVNVNKPIPFDSSEVIAFDAKRGLLRDMLSVEEKVNDALQKKGFDVVSVVFDSLSKLPSSEDKNNLDKEYDSIIKIHFDETTKYLTGKHLRFFQSINSGKKILMNDLKEELMAKSNAKNTPEERYRIFESFMIVQDAIRLHEKILKDNPNISPGAVSKILNETSSELLKLWYKIDATNDVHFSNVLKDHGRAYHQAVEPTAVSLQMP